MTIARNYLLVLFSIFGFYFTYTAGPSIDYTGAIKQSISNSPKYKYINFELKSRQMNPAIQLGKILPRLDIQGFVATKNLPDQQKYSNTSVWQSDLQASVNLTQTLYDYSAYNSLQAAKQKARFAQQDYKTKYQQFLYDVSYAYFNLAKSIKNARYSLYNLQSSEQSFKEVESKYQAGVASIADYTTAKANYYIAKADYAASQKEEKVADAKLRKFTSKDNDILLYSDKFITKDPSPNTQKSWQELTMKTSPSYLGAIYTKQSKYYDYQSAKGPFMPKVDFEINYSVNHSNTNLQTFYFGINLIWNIFAGGTSYTGIKKKAYDYQSSEFNLIQTQRLTQNDTTYVFRFVKLKKRAIKQLRKSVESAKIAYQKYRQRYQQGTTTITQYLMLLNQYYRFMIQLNNAEFDYIMGFLSLYKTAGMLKIKTVQDFNSWLLSDQSTTSN